MSCSSAPCEAINHLNWKEKSKLQRGHQSTHTHTHTHLMSTKPCFCYLCGIRSGIVLLSRGVPGKKDLTGFVPVSPKIPALITSTYLFILLKQRIKLKQPNDVFLSMVFLSRLQPGCLLSSIMTSSAF